MLTTGWLTARPQLAKVEGARLFLQSVQDVSVGARASRTQFQYTSPEFTEGGGNRGDVVLGALGVTAIIMPKLDGWQSLAN
jgi:hypothetical protein